MQLVQAGEAFLEDAVDMRSHGEGLVDQHTKDTGGRDTPDGVGTKRQGECTQTVT
jgi:hypothetical protein